MAIDWTLYETRLKINGNTIRDRQINLMKDAMTNNFSTSPSYRISYFNGSLTATDIQVTDDKEHYIKNILMNPSGTLNAGDIIVFDSQTWLCTEVDKTNPVYQLGKVFLTTQTLSLYKNHILYQIPAVISSEIRLYSTGTEENKYFIVNDDEMIVTVSNNSDAQNIAENDLFTIGRRSYEVQSIQDAIQPGLLILKMKVNVQSPEAHVFALTILNGSSLQINTTQPLTINAELTDNGVVVPNPSLVYSSSNNNIATISSSGVVTILTTGTVIFTVAMTNDATVNDTISVEIITVDQHNYTVDISGNTSIIKGNTSNYTCVFKDNGIAITDTSVFYLTADDGVSATSLATISSQDGVVNSCVVTGNSLGYVKLWVKNVGETIVSQALRIQIKNLF